MAQTLLLQCGPIFIRGGPGVQLDINFRNKEKVMLDIKHCRTTPI